MKIKKTINLKSNFDLFRMACTIGELRMLYNCAQEQAEKEPPPKGVLETMKSLFEAVSIKFWMEFNEIYPEFAGNKMALGGKKDGIDVIVYDEKLDEDCEDCECDEDEGQLSIDKIMEEAGVQNADDWGRA